MFEVTVEDTFAAGHYLRNYKGKCENPHGHNYKIRVTLAGAELDKAGLLLDFKDLREVMRHVIERLDHQMINEIEPFTVINPSAENLAKYFYDESNTRLQSVTKGRVRVKDVTVFETDTTTAKYSERIILRSARRPSSMATGRGVGRLGADRWLVMQITEIYKSLQGESTYAGLPCVFVRLTGCNLRCSWCDSEYTFPAGAKWNRESMEEVQKLSPGGGLVKLPEANRCCNSGKSFR